MNATPPKQPRPRGIAAMVRLGRDADPVRMPAVFGLTVLGTRKVRWKRGR